MTWTADIENALAALVRLHADRKTDLRPIDSDPEAPTYERTMAAIDLDKLIRRLFVCKNCGGQFRLGRSDASCHACKQTWPLRWLADHAALSRPETSASESVRPQAEPSQPVSDPYKLPTPIGEGASPDPAPTQPRIKFCRKCKEWETSPIHYTGKCEGDYSPAPIGDAKVVPAREDDLLQVARDIKQYVDDRISSYWSRQEPEPTPEGGDLEGRK